VAGTELAAGQWSAPRRGWSWQAGSTDSGGGVESGRAELDGGRHRCGEQMRQRKQKKSMFTCEGAVQRMGERSKRVGMNFLKHQLPRCIHQLTDEYTVRYVHQLTNEYT
jgi:hypothetical protein